MLAGGGHPVLGRAGHVGVAEHRRAASPTRSTNCRDAVEAALANGGTGFLNTDWGDRGHLQQLPISEPGLAYGAAVSWCLEANADLDLGAALSAHAFDDPTGELAAALLAIGDAHRALTPQIPNHSILAMHLYFPQIRFGRGITRGQTGEELDTVDGRARRAPTPRCDRGPAAPRRRRAPRRRDALDHRRARARSTDDARARMAGDGTLASVPEPERRHAGRSARLPLDRHRALWLARNRPGGLDDNAAWLDNLRAAYISGAPDRELGRMAAAVQLDREVRSIGAL